MTILDWAIVLLVNGSIIAYGLYLARGEVVVMNDTLHVRISEVVGDREPSERDYV